ncbi:hypothetical protein [Rahnella perminowiae]|uniref:hypothetical protein n=1 Tax=Rahnella perminowiae TaxID=2816244 RepID=UPI00215BF08D|nr:hypothetical protein [Rahnella perminowiae]MCR8998553.1 hypothetical protein [Rahnella perminowiae]
MQCSALKSGAGACWATVRLMIDVLVIGPVFIFSLFIVVNAWPSPGAFVIRQAEGLVEGAAPGNVWGCAALPATVNERALPQPVTPSPYQCVPEQVRRETYITGFNHNLLNLYGLLTTLYACVYLAARWLMVGRKGRKPVVAFGMAVQGGKQEQKHE